jgi:hypothetical protein
LLKGVCLWELHEGNELCLERFRVDYCAYVAFGGVVSKIQIDLLFEQIWALDHLASMKITVGQKAM